MRWALLAVAALLVGIVMGGGAMLVAGAPPPAVIEPGPAPTTHPTAASPPVTASVPSPPGSGVLLVWTPSRLPDGLADGVARLAGVERVTVVRSDLVYLAASADAGGRVVDQPPPGFAVPLEAVAVDLATYPALLPQAWRSGVEGLGPGEALLGSTSAELRGLGVGGRLILEGEHSLVVTGITEDTLIGAAEVVVAAAPGAELGVSTPRYLLVELEGDRSRFEADVRSLLPPGVAVRVRGPGETPFLRHGDAVLPQALIKQTFGEFAIRRGDGREFIADPAWLEESIATQDVPLLGAVTCHRAFLPALEGALGELERRKLGFLVDPEGFRGCWSPRFIAVGRGISRHAWGVAVDVNFTENPTGLGTAQDERLVEVMERWGLTWGGWWLVPDPAHFEYAHSPRP